MTGPHADRRVVVVTGGSSGIGADGHVADFAHLGQVRQLAAELGRRHPRIDVLVNNAGLIAGARRTVTADARELTFQVNHLAPFLLTMLLRDPLSAARASVITTSSRAGTARDARMDPDDLDMAAGYDALRACKAGKLASMLFTRELARRWAPLEISAAAVHPAWSGRTGASQGQRPCGRS